MKNKSILIVDNEAIFRESIRDWLKNAGYQVITARSGEEAVEIINQENFGIIIADIRLSGMNGLRLLQEVKRINPDIKSIVITAYPTAEYAAEAKKLGAVDYLVKPIVPDELEDLIKETLEKV